MKTKEQKMIAASRSVSIAKRALKLMTIHNAEPHMILLAEKNLKSAEARLAIISAN